MSERLHADEPSHEGGVSYSGNGRRVRMVREPALTGGDWAAYAVIIVMVCGPLALGAFGL